VALRLKRMGITRVRPLQGGFEAWQAKGFPLEPLPLLEESPPLSGTA
jgi:3-mercaptopyruvate sulfurtransferase SseA